MTRRQTGSREGHSPDALRWATDAHYEDAERYDRTYRLRRHDVAFYREMAAEHGGPVLELGVGTGRVAIGRPFERLAEIHAPPKKPSPE